MTALLPFYAGLRLGEVVALNVEDVQLHRWITQERQGCLGAEGPALLLNYRGERLSARGAHNALTTIAEQVGIDDLTAHVLGLPVVSSPKTTVRTEG